MVRSNSKSPKPGKPPAPPPRSSAPFVPTGGASPPRLDWKLTALVAATIFSLTLCCYWRAQWHGFATTDDSKYLDDPHVRGGLTAASAWWAFTSVHFANWHPLTSLSYIVDQQLWNESPRPLHLENILLHALNGALLYLVLQSMTGLRWRSAFVATIFALHPLRVESVVWIAERKDVLSGFFWILAMAAYAAYARRGGLARYALMAALVAAGLMSKPMVVSLPLVFLLLDYWPLDRLRSAGGAPASLRHLISEKAPLLLLVAGSCAVTLIAQIHGRAVVSVATVPLPLRCNNAVVAYGEYLWNFAWPTRLAAFYPLEAAPDRWQVVLCAAVLIVLSFAAIYWRKSRPYLVTGWLWYLISLLPVIGLVQVGAQSMADRYTYLPLIGITIMAVWAVADLLSQWPAKRPLLAGAIAIVLLPTLMVMTIRQAAYWADDLTLSQHTAEIQPDSPTANVELGRRYQLRNRLNDAAASYATALRLDPKFAWAHYNLALLQLREGDIANAERETKEAVRLDPGDADAQYLYATQLHAHGDVAAATEHYRIAVAINPQSPARNNLAWTLATNANPAERNGPQAVAMAQAMLHDAEDWKLAEVLDTLAAAYAEAGDFPSAIQSAQRAQKLAAQAQNARLEQDVKSRLELYRQHKPYHEPPQQSATQPATAP